MPCHAIPFHSPPLLPGQAEPSLFSPAKIVGRTAGAGLCSCLCWSAGRLTKRSDHSSTRARAQCNYAYTSIHPTHRRRSLSFCSLSLSSPPPAVASRGKKTPSLQPPTGPLFSQILNTLFILPVDMPSIYSAASDAFIPPPPSCAMIFRTHGHFSEQTQSRAAGIIQARRRKPGEISSRGRLSRIAESHTERG